MMVFLLLRNAAAALCLLTLLTTACDAAATKTPVLQTTAATTATVTKAQHAPPPLTLPNTEVHRLQANGRTYQVWVDLPASYFQNDKAYPMLLVTDANYSFPLVRSIRARVGQNGANIEDFVLVGLGYAEGDSPAQSRSRDYTPTNPKKRPGWDKSSYSATEYGGAAQHLHYLQHQVLPLLKATYRLDERRFIYAGHSYGALFGSYVLFHQPELFQSYILGSPSFWFDQRESFRLEQQYASRAKDLPAQLLFYVGEYEAIGPAPLFNQERDLVKDMDLMVRTLKSRNYPRLKLQQQVLPGDDHLTAYPNLITKALRQLLPGHGPYQRG